MVTVNLYREADKKKKKDKNAKIGKIFRFNKHNVGSGLQKPGLIMSQLSLYCIRKREGVEDRLDPKTVTAYSLGAA